MKIALVSRRVGRGSGTAGYVDQLARALVQGGHQVDVWTQTQQGGEPPIYGVQSLPGSVFRGLLGMVVRASRSQSIADRGYDVVQGFGRTRGHDVFRASGGVHRAWLDASGANRWSLRDRIETALDRAACLDARRVICTSSRVAEEVVALYGVDEALVRIVRNGVSDVRFRPDSSRRRLSRRAWGVSDKGRVLLFLGHGFWRKGLRCAAAGFARAGRTADRFVVIGDDRNARVWRRELTRMLGNRLVWWGPVARPEHWLPGADATVLPTLYDAGANTTLESLASGVPTVVSEMDGNAEVVPFKDWVVSGGASAIELANAIDSAWSAGTHHRAACVEEARRWSVDRNTMATEQVYHEVLHG